MIYVLHCMGTMLEGPTWATEGRIRQVLILIHFDPFLPRPSDPQRPAQQASTYG